MPSWNPLRGRARATFAVTAFLCLTFPLTPASYAAEVAVLKNGFSIRHERREIVGAVTRLYVNAEGSSYVDIPTEQIEHFEPAPELPVNPPSPRPAPSGPVAATASVSGSAPRITRASVQATPAPKRDLSEVVNEASGRYRLDPDLVNSVIKAESGFNVGAVSPKGAQGLMQLMPGTASQLGVPNTFDAQQNVEGGARYLRELLERYDFDLVKALAAYNAGPERVERFGGVPPYYETRKYVARIVKDFNKKKLSQQKAAQAASSEKAKVNGKKPAADAHAAAKTEDRAQQSAKSSLAKTSLPSNQ
jgi:hypothetical protein